MTEDTFRWVITGAVMISTLCIIVVAVAAIMIHRAVSNARVRMEKTLNRVEPMIDTAKKLADESVSKISAITSDAVVIAANARDVSEVAKEQAHRFADVGRDFTDRAKVQIARVDAAMDETVEQVQHVGETMKIAVLKPVKEAGAVLAGVKAAVQSYAMNGKRPPVDHIPQDEEMFI